MTAAWATFYRTVLRFSGFPSSSSNTSSVSGRFPALSRELSIPPPADLRAVQMQARFRRVSPFADQRGWRCEDFGCVLLTWLRPPLPGAKVSGPPISAVGAPGQPLR